MDKLPLMIVLFLLFIIEPSKGLEINNKTVQYGILSLLTRNLSKDIDFKTFTEHPSVEAEGETKKLTEASDITQKNNQTLRTMKFTNYPESVINLSLSKISSNETEDENVSFVRTNDPLNVPSENVLVHSSVQGDNAIETSTSISNQSFISYSSNDDLAVKETSAVSSEIEGVQEYITQTFTPSDHFELGNDSLTAVTSPDSKSSLSTGGVEPLTRVHNNFSNYPITIAEEEKFNPINHSILRSTPLPSENNEDYLFTTLSGDDEIIRTDDTTPNSTSSASENSKSHLVDRTVREITTEYFELGNDSLTTMISPNSNSPLSTVGVEPPRHVRNNFSNYSVTTSKEETLSPINHPITSSTPLPSENTEDYLFTTLSGDDEIIHTDDTTSNFTSSASENSESHLVDTFVREITTEYFELGNDSLTAISPNPNSSLSTVGVELPTHVIHEANVEIHSIENATENNNTNYLINITDIGTILENSTIDVSSKGLDKHAAHTSMIPEVLFSKTLTDSTSHPQDNSETLLPESTSSSSNQNILDSIPEKDASLRQKENLNKVYKLVLTGNCSDTLSSHEMQSINQILNRKLNAKNSTELVRCVNVYEFNFTSDLVSRESFDKAVRLIHETINPDLKATIANYTSIVNNVLYNQHDDSENFVISKFIAYSLSGVIVAIFLIIFVIFCFCRKRKNNSESVDLSYIPHVASSIDEYKVAPIPRPSISYPETNRDFLHAYSNETYNRTPDEFIVQRHFSNGKETNEPTLQKEKSVILKLETFNIKGDAKGKRPKLNPDFKNASAGNWDRLRGEGVIKRQGQDTFSMNW